MRLSGETTHDRTSHAEPVPQRQPRSPLRNPHRTKAGEVGIDVVGQTRCTGTRIQIHKRWSSNVAIDRRLPDNNTSVRESFPWFISTPTMLLEHYSHVINERHRAASQALGLDTGDMEACVPIDDA